jgi:hypothetical protein
MGRTATPVERAHTLALEPLLVHHAPVENTPAGARRRALTVGRHVLQARWKLPHVGLEVIGGFH